MSATVLELTPGREDAASPAQDKEGGDGWGDRQGLLPDQVVSPTGAAALGADGPAATSASAVNGSTVAAAQGPGVRPDESSPFAQMALLQVDAAGRAGAPDQAAAAGQRPAGTPRGHRHSRARTPRTAHLAEEPAAARVSLDGECVTPRRMGSTSSDAVFAWTGVDLVGCNTDPVCVSHMAHHESMLCPEHLACQTQYSLQHVG